MRRTESDGSLKAEPRTGASPMKRWATFALLVFALNFGWEMAQSVLYANMKAMAIAAATGACLRAALADLLIFAITYATAAIACRDRTWPAHRRHLAFAVFFITALSITVAYERFAIRTGQWRYDVQMPLILGVGIAPLLQWLAVPAAALAIYRRLWRSGASEDRASL